MNLRRRDLFRLAGAGAAGWLLGCGDNEPYRLPGAAHASAILEPEVDSLVVAVWSSIARAATIEVRAGDEIVQATIVGLTDDHAAATITGLSPDTDYQITMLTDDGTRLGPHFARHRAERRRPRPVRLAVSADLDPQPGVRERHLRATSPGAVRNCSSRSATSRTPTTVRPRDDRRGVSRSATPSCGRRRRCRAWLQAMAMRAIYDDHEFRNDWDAMFVAAEPSAMPPRCRCGTSSSRCAAAVGDVRYRTWRWGANVECFLLDCRRFRSANAAPDDAAQDDARRDPARLVRRRRSRARPRRSSWCSRACRSTTATATITGRRTRPSATRIFAALGRRRPACCSSAATSTGSRRTATRTASASSRSARSPAGSARPGRCRPGRAVSQRPATTSASIDMRRRAMP